MADFLVNNSRPIMLRFELIDRDPNQPRQSFGEEATEAHIRGLAENIKLNGLLNPIYVKIHPELEGRYMLAAGECRFRALRLLGIEELEFRLINREIPAYVISLVENDYRKDLNLIERAESYRECMRTEHLSVAELALKIGKSQGEVYRLLRFLNLPPEVQKLVREGKIKQGNLKHFAQFKNVAEQIELAKRLIAGEDPPELIEADTAEASERHVIARLPTTPEGLISRMLKFRRNSSLIVHTFDAFLALSEEEQVKAWASFTAGTRETFVRYMNEVAARIVLLNSRMAKLPETKHTPIGIAIARTRPEVSQKAPLPVSVNPVGRVTAVPSELTPTEAPRIIERRK